MMNKQIETNQCGLFKLQQTVFHPLCGVAGAGDAHVRSATHRKTAHALQGPQSSILYDLCI